jgi:hypothetical protein
MQMTIMNTLNARRTQHDKQIMTITTFTNNVNATILNNKMQSNY